MTAICKSSETNDTKEDATNKWCVNNMRGFHWECLQIIKHSGEGFPFMLPDGVVDERKILHFLENHLIYFLKMII
jgi:hypothetical protein